MTTYHLGGTDLTELTEALAVDDRFLVNNKSDTTTAPADADGSSQWTTPPKTAAAFASMAGDKVSAQLLGADPTGTTAIDTIVNAIISGAPTTGVDIFLGEGTFKISTGLVAHLAGTQTVRLLGAATMSTTLLYFGSGDAVHMYNDSADGSGGAQSYFSGVRDLTVDGTHATGSPVGIHAGDISFLQVQNVIIQNFAGTSSAGLHLDNATTWTEEGDHRAVISNCTRGLVLEVTTGFNSFGYNSFDITFFQSGAQSCFCVINGALFYHGTLKARGDVNGSASSLTGNPAFFFVSGVGPGGSQAIGANPGIVACHLDVLVEPNNLGGTATHFMSTFYLDNASSFGFVNECYGILDFGQGTGAFTPIDPSVLAGNGNNFTQFSGIVNGDSNLNPSGVLGWNMWGSGSILNYLPGFTAFDGFFPTAFGDVFFTTLDGTNSTFALNYSGIGNGDTLAGPQRKLMFIRQPASGGPFTLGFVVAGSGTTAAPTIVWAGGAAPVLSPVANGTDVIEMLTWDGATWYGRHLASYGTATDQAVTLRPEAQRVTLTTAFTETSSTSAQSVTGLSTVLQPGTYKVTGWFPFKQSTGTTATQKLSWAFSGTLSDIKGKWLMSSGTTQSPVLITAVGTASALSPTMTSALVAIGEFSGQLVVTAAGTLQLQATASATSNEVQFPVGCYLDVEPLA